MKIIDTKCTIPVLGFGGLGAQCGVCKRQPHTRVQELWVAFQCALVLNSRGSTSRPHGVPWILDLVDMPVHLRHGGTASSPKLFHMDSVVAGRVLLYTTFCSGTWRQGSGRELLGTPS